MTFPEDLLYTREHEWVCVEEEIAVIGITDYAQDQLGEIVYIELPEEGEEVSMGEAFGSIDSVKAASELYSPLSGTITEVNDPLRETPELVNEDPYDDGWMIKVRMSDLGELDELMNAQQYQAHVNEESE